MIVGVAERRSTIAAEAPGNDLRATESSRFALGPKQIPMLHSDKRCKIVSKGLLAHAAMTDVWIDEGAGYCIAHGTALRNRQWRAVFLP